MLFRRAVLVPHHFLDNPQKISAHDLLDIFLFVAAAQQGIGERGHFGEIFQADRYKGKAVEVATDADMIDASDFHNMVDTFGGIFQRGCAGFRESLFRVVLCGELIKFGPLS